ncbi:hypothetical protein DFH28DRAFT_1229701 [Melampsora americana]|nr:hypothetical protein DFH28DRAFT_1229701 [Melampsora americana]
MSSSSSPLSHFFNQSHPYSINIISIFDGFRYVKFNFASTNPTSLLDKSFLFSYFSFVLLDRSNFGRSSFSSTNQSPPTLILSFNLQVSTKSLPGSPFPDHHL